MLLLDDMTSRGRTLPNQRWNNVLYVNVQIYNVEQRRINVVYFNFDISNVRQRRNNVVIIFNVEFHNVDQRRNIVVNMTIFKKLKRAQKYFLASRDLINNTCFRLRSIKKKGKHWTYNAKINVRKDMHGKWKEYENNGMSLLMAK